MKTTDGRPVCMFVVVFKDEKTGQVQSMHSAHVDAESAIFQAGKKVQNPDMHYCGVIDCGEIK